MSTLYLIALAAFACMFCALVVDALRTVGRPPVWERSRARLDMPLEAQRRHLHLPFVGRDRRAAKAAPEGRQPEAWRKAA